MKYEITGISKSPARKKMLSFGLTTIVVDKLIGNLCTYAFVRQ